MVKCWVCLGADWLGKVLLQDAAPCALCISIVRLSVVCAYQLISTGVVLSCGTGGCAVVL
jgi:hypothetical protein